MINYLARWLESKFDVLALRKLVPHAAPEAR
jgi:hypothetical protein